MRAFWLELEGRPLWLAAGAFVLGVIVTLLLALIFGGDGDGSIALPTTTTTVGATTSTAPGTDPGGEPTVPPTTSTTLPAGPLTANPLTGQMLPTPSTQGVVAVKIDNVRAARPQIGLNGAGMILEFPVEGGLTRLTALYFGELPELSGPVRSVRPVDADLLAPFRPLFVHTGGRDFVMRLVDAAGISSFDIRGSAFFIPGRPAPHDIALALEQVIPSIGGPPAVDVLPFGDGGSAASPPHPSTSRSRQ